MANLRVLYFPQDRPAEVREIQPDLSAFQALVGGDVENVFLLRRPGGVTHALVVNDEYLLNGLRPNVGLPPLLYRGGLTVHGPCFLTAYDPYGDSVSLSETECEEWRQMLEPHRACRILGLEEEVARA